MLCCRFVRGAIVAVRGCLRVLRRGVASADAVARAHVQRVP